jgi:hypothetical protein
MWMTGEFYFNDGIREWVKPLFLLGMAIIAYYYLSDYLIKKRKDIQ